MVKKSTQRVQKLRESRKKQGFIRAELWVHKDDFAQLKNYNKLLTKIRTCND